MPAPERFLALLKEQIAQHADEAFVPGASNQNAFGYGKACGIREGLKIAEALFEKVLDEEIQEVRGGKNNPRR